MAHVRVEKQHAAARHGRVHARQRCVCDALHLAARRVQPVERHREVELRRAARGVDVDEREDHGEAVRAVDVPPLVAAARVARDDLDARDVLEPERRDQLAPRAQRRAAAGVRRVRRARRAVGRGVVVAAAAAPSSAAPAALKDPARRLGADLPARELARGPELARAVVPRERSGGWSESSNEKRLSVFTAARTHRGSISIAVPGVRDAAVTTGETLSLKIETFLAVLKFRNP